MGKSERLGLESRLLIRIAHLLEWQYQHHTLSGRWSEFYGKVACNDRRTTQADCRPLAKVAGLGNGCRWCCGGHVSWCSRYGGL